jgi:hypothetical protein
VESLGAGLDGEHRAEKTPGVLVNRVGQQLAGGRLLNHLTRIHHGDPVRQLGHEGQVVRDEDHREAELLTQLVEQVDDLLLNGHVQRGRRFVGQDQGGVSSQRHGDENTLTLTAGELVRVAAQRALGVESHQIEQLLGTAGASARTELCHLGADEHGGVQ